MLVVGECDPFLLKHGALDLRTAESEVIAKTTIAEHDAMAGDERICLFECQKLGVARLVAGGGLASPESGDGG